VSRNNDNGYDFDAVTIMASDSDPLAQAFAEERTGFQVVPFWEKSPVNPAWYLASVGTGRGTFEVTLFLVTSNPHRYMFLGEDLKRGVQKACEIMIDPTEETETWWAPVEG